MERTKAEERVNALRGIKLYEEVIKVLESDAPLQWGSVLEGRYYQLPDDMKPELIRFFRKLLEFHTCQLRLL